VTVVHQGGQILSREDSDIAASLQKALEQEGLAFILNASTTKVRGGEGEIILDYELNGEPRTVSGSHLLIATGRTPNIEDLDLANAGVATDEHGFIHVNDRLETNVPGIWAIGDVKGGPAFTHISYNDFQIIQANLRGEKKSIAGRIVPYAVFTDPQLGGIGITEREARKRGYKLKIGKVEMTHVARAIERDETAGLMKVVVDAATDRILGASILSTEGGELVQILGTLMLAGQPYTLLKGAVYIHPTLAEGFFALMDNVKTID
jgi:pyruvate/2-oxoglutarate dehydrogenase complex dihydrolipoamide dehydrogenase (E3) component